MWSHFFFFFLRAKKLFKSGFDLHFKLKSEISAFNRDVCVLRLNIPREGYMTSLPQIPNLSPAASTQVLRLRHQKTSYSRLASYFLLPACLNRFIILFPVSYLWAVLLLSYWAGGGSVSFITDPSLISTLICMLHWTPIRNEAALVVEMSCFWCSRGRVIVLLPFFFFLPWQQSATNLARVDKAFTMHMQRSSSSLNISFSLGRTPSWAL